MSWAPKPLSEILDQSGRHRAGDQDLPVLSITMKHGLVDQAEKFKKRVASSDTSNYRIAYKNELVVGFPIDEGVLGFQTKYPAGIVSPAYDVWRLKEETDCHIPYLERYLRSSQARSLYALRMQGAVARRRSLTKTDFLNLEIPFPPIYDQVRIAHLLGKVEGLIAQRKQHLQQLDDLLKSVFLDMFGDPVRNGRGWETHSLGSISDVQGGLQVTSKRNDYEMDAPYLRVANVYRDRLNLNEIKRIGLTPAELSRVRLRKGDLLIVEGHGNPEEIGRSAVWDGSIENCVHQNHLIRVRVDSSQLTPLYASFFINSPSGRQQMFRAGKTTSGLNTISSKNVKETMVAVPPIGFQNQFAAIVEKVEGIKSRCQQSLTDLEALYGALSQQAFKGELDLSRVPMPGVGLEEDKAVAPEPLHTPAEQGLAINLPNTDSLLAALESTEVREGLMAQWLETYRGQLGSTPFSVQHFMAAAQTRLAELYPDNDFALGANDYEHIKAWVFDALAAGTLAQAFDDAGNRIELKAVQA
ncbi:MAG: restriction endonuclease subunit S [Gammaproteobacteria bacterium]|nr:restriction endonuclease subunit S [Gammaproteobacteria bacterium]